MSPAMEDLGLDFLDQAPLKLTFHAEIEAEPRRVYAALADDLDTWTWFPTVTGGRNLDGRREAVGARCEIQIGGLKAVETILAADPGRRWAYGVTRLAIPLASALVEDWVLSEQPATSTRPVSTRVSYTFALDPRPLARRFTTLSGAGIGLVFAKAAANLGRKLAGDAIPDRNRRGNADSAHQTGAGSVRGDG